MQCWHTVCCLSAAAQGGPSALSALTIGNASSKSAHQLLGQSGLLLSFLNLFSSAIDCTLQSSALDIDSQCICADGQAYPQPQAGGYRNPHADAWE